MYSLLFKERPFVFLFLWFSGGSPLAFFIVAVLAVIIAITARVNVSFIWELLKNIVLPFNIGSKKLQQYLNTCFLNLQFSMVMPLLLLEAGDVLSKPGRTHEHTLFVLHLNIRSIRNKISY